jgi:hypothetical protein
MIKDLKAMLCKPTIQSLLEKEVYETKVNLLQAHSNLEYSTAMVTYYKQKLLRLESTKP